MSSKHNVILHNINTTEKWQNLEFIASLTMKFWLIGRNQKSEKFKVITLS